MSKQKKFLVVGAFSCAAVLFGVAGCGNSGSEDPGSAQSTQAIQSNPNMPPQARAAAEASMKQGQAQGEAAARTAAQSAPK